MKQVCHIHQDTELVRLYLNANQAIAMKVDYVTDLFYCVKCKEPIRLVSEIVSTRKQVVPKMDKAQFFFMARQVYNRLNEVDQMSIKIQVMESEFAGLGFNAYNTNTKNLICAVMIKDGFLKGVPKNIEKSLMKRLGKHLKPSVSEVRKN